MPDASGHAERRERAMEAMLRMAKLDISLMKRAYDGQ
jgi:hypothetical protein